MSSTASKIKKAVLVRPLYDEAYKQAFKSHWITGAIIFLILLGIATMLIFEAFTAGIGMMIIAIGLLIVRVAEPALSDEGKRIKNHLKGLREWLKAPSPEKLNELMEHDPNYLFSMFPYAIAYGLDDSWQKSMDDMHIDPPVWYDTSGIHMTTGGYTMGRMISDFQPKEIGQVFNSMPPPPKSSSGGGGFSGSGRGGMGGGSVSSW